MVATVIALIIILLSVAYLYLKCGALASFSTFIAGVVGLVVAFAYYESLGGFILSKGHLGQWALPLVYILLFVTAFAIVRSAADFIMGEQVEFGALITKITAVVCGILLGMIISGAVFVTMSLAPLGPKWPYKRFADSGISIRSLDSPSKPLINADGFAAGLFSWISKGSFSSKKSFAVYHDDFVNQVHLNGLKAKESVYTIAGKKAVSIPSRGIRTLGSDNENLTMVRLTVKNGPIERGGAQDPDSKVSFTLSQIRLICKDKNAKSDSPTSGSGVAVYPKGRVVGRRQAAEDAKIKELTGLMDGRVVLEQNLDDIITLTSDDLKADGPKLDIAFDVPANMEAVLLEFKQNAVTKAPPTVQASEENEDFLRTGGKTEPDGNPGVNTNSVNTNG
jgi:hypothetical protein